MILAINKPIIFVKCLSLRNSGSHLICDWHLQHNQFPDLVSNSDFKWKKFQFFIVGISHLPRRIDKDNRRRKPNENSVAAPPSR